MIHNFTHMLPINPALNCTKIAISVSFKSVRPERRGRKVKQFNWILISPDCETQWLKSE